MIFKIDLKMWALIKCGWPVTTTAISPNTCLISNGFAAMGIAILRRDRS
ncbi:hypothetical protein [Kamptonema sp. PCC 6506]|nr:hypothetical protein [Kamptonema sp. PCC 6506]